MSKKVWEYNVRFELEDGCELPTEIRGAADRLTQLVQSYERLGPLGSKLGGYGISLGDTERIFKGDVTRIKAMKVLKRVAQAWKS